MVVNGSVVEVDGAGNRFPSSHSNPNLQTAAGLAGVSAAGVSTSLPQTPEDTLVRELVYVFQVRGHFAVLRTNTHTEWNTDQGLAYIDGSKVEKEYILKSLKKHPVCQLKCSGPLHLFVYKNLQKKLNLKKCIERAASFLSLQISYLACPYVCNTFYSKHSFNFFGISILITFRSVFAGNRRKSNQKRSWHIKVLYFKVINRT